MSPLLCRVWLLVVLALLPAAAFAQPPSAPESAPKPHPPRLALLGTRVTQGPPGLAAQVDARLTSAARALGYEPAPRPALEAARRRVGAGSPHNPAELWQITYLANADYGVVVRIEPEGSAYALRVEVAARDGSGPFFASDTVPLAEVPARVDPLIRSVLPDETPPPPASAPEAAPHVEPGERAPPKSERPAVGDETRRWHVAAQTEAALGVSSGFFYNHLAGLRLDYRFGPRVLFGGYVGYVNLDGKTGRENNLLVYAQVDYRLPVTKTGVVQIPFRAATGYLPLNGPFAKAATGVGFNTESGVDIILELLAPALWVSNDLTVVSLDVGLEVGYPF